MNVIFEIEARKTANQETLVIVDDLADSFDYRNKYAIIRYLKDISEDGLFKLLIGHLEKCLVASHRWREWQFAGMSVRK